MTSTETTLPPQTLSLMNEIISYPILLQHEESFTSQTTLYDVSSWLLYISEIDSLIEELNNTLTSIASSKRNKGSLSLSTTIIGGKHMKLHFDTIQNAISILYKVRNLVSERALTLLPGSYKIWKNYLDFRSNVFIQSNVSVFMNKSNTEEKGISSSLSYPIVCSNKALKYKSTISAYERSLVRMNKYPRIWLSYIHFVIANSSSIHNTNNNNNTNNHDNDITTIRRLFNRALLALPATQHDLIWNEYLCWILNSIPPNGLFVSRGKNVDGPLVLACKKNGGILPYYDNPSSTTITNMKDDDDDDDDDNHPIALNLNVNIPSETILRILRRYAYYYNPTARELLAKTAVQLGHYGEGASLYCDILNDVDFLSVEGTTRHELWMELANVCTEHPEEVREAGVDFDGIVRAVLKPPTNQRGYSGFGWDIFDLKSSKGDNSNYEGDNNNNNNGENDEEQQKQKKIIEQRNQLQASLGEMEGTLWSKLAQFYIRMGEFELARSIYEEAMESVMRVRDFSLIFDGYIKFEEGVIEAMMEMMNEDEDDKNEDIDETVADVDDDDDGDLDILLGDSDLKKRTKNNDDDEENISADVELALARAENLMSRRPLLLNYVLLRQNPHNVGEWLKRAELYLNLNQTLQALSSLEESVKAVAANQAINGSPAELYKALAKIYEVNMRNVEKSRSVFERVCCELPEYRFREPDELAQCYSSWVEMELRYEKWDQALSIARRSVAHVPAAKSTKVTRGLSRSMRLWNLLLDLEESLGTLQTTKDAYNRLLEMKAATPAHIINFTSYLTENKYFEECFTAFERGLDMFSFPHPGAKLIWKRYLSEFLSRYGGTKTHRSRELFDRCLESCPPEDASEFFIMYGKFEEEFGLTKRALGIYERMCTVVPVQEKFSSYQLHIAKTIKYLGITATRPIYERAISALEDDQAASICCDFAKMEASLQEIDRARTAFTYGAQLADPRRNPEYWGEWHSFEVSHGNEETFREMLRVKRGVQAAFSTVNYNAVGMGSAPQQENLTDEQAIAMIKAREGVENEDKEPMSGFVQAKRPAQVQDLDEVERRAAKLRKVTASLVTATSQNRADNDDEIDIDDDNNSSDGDEQSSMKIKEIQTKELPATVFGGLAKQV